MVVWFPGMMILISALLKRSIHFVENKILIKSFRIYRDYWGLGPSCSRLVVTCVSPTLMSGRFSTWPTVMRSSWPIWSTGIPSVMFLSWRCIKKSNRCVDYYSLYWRLTLFRYVLSDKSGRAAWPQESYSSVQVQSRVWRQFGDTSLPCPQQPEEYLTRWWWWKW